MKVSDLAIKNRISIFVLTGAVILLGFMSYLSLPRESTPSITIPIVFVATPYFGVAPADIENLVTQPIEKHLEELSNVKVITSTSSEGISTVVIEFETDVDINNPLLLFSSKFIQTSASLSLPSFQWPSTDVFSFLTKSTLVTPSSVR